ncbi:XRE family transcriptional regulator [Ruminococcaceae bacterium OttesenSCG-928-A16]|nr:XRE family transcriptional regulator [Ruminococcaceae bacterium OttesenSCG-928-A16]
MKTAIENIARISHNPVQAPEQIKALMEKLGMNERAFALVMNVSPVTVRMWLCGAAVPCNASSRLMQVYASEPDIINRLCEGNDAC